MTDSTVKIVTLAVNSVINVVQIPYVPLVPPLPKDLPPIEKVIPANVPMDTMLKLPMEVKNSNVEVIKKYNIIYYNNFFIIILIIKNVTPNVMDVPKEPTTVKNVPTLMPLNPNVN